MTVSICLGLGEQAVSRNPDDVLVAYGLGSCLGICMSDPVARVSGLLHAVLPDDLNPAEPRPASTSGKYVEHGIESLLASMLGQGASRSRIIVRMVGGANMLMISNGMTTTFDIGTRNIEKARAVFKRLNMKIAAEEVGGHNGRTVRVYVADNRVTVKVIGEKEHEL